MAAGRQTPARSDWLFSPVCEILQMPLEAPEKQKHMIFFSDYLSHALLSGYRDRFIKITFFYHIFSISTHCNFNGVLYSTKTYRNTLKIHCELEMDIKTASHISKMIYE